jgi:glycine C-acetyltransferase
LCKAQRHRYKHMDMQDLEEKLKATSDSRTRMIVTDGVFSMDGDIAPLQEICDLAEKYGAVVMIDECHASGFLGETGRGTPELCGVQGRIGIINNTLGKALGGATGGYTTGPKEVIQLLRQKSRPYLFSNTITPAVVGASFEVFRLLSASNEQVGKLQENVKHFRTRMVNEGFTLSGDDRCPIVPVMIGDAKLANQMSDKLLSQGIYVIGFSYPVVPKDQARIRCQLSSLHSLGDIDRCVDAFVAARDKKD